MTIDMETPGANYNGEPGLNYLNEFKNLTTISEWISGIHLFAHKRDIRLYTSSGPKYLNIYVYMIEKSHAYNIHIIKINHNNPEHEFSEQLLLNILLDKVVKSKNETAFTKYLSDVFRTELLERKFTML